MKLQKAALERENLELRNSQYASQEMKKPPVMPRMSPQPQLTSTPVQTSNQVLILIFMYRSNGIYTFYFCIVELEDVTVT